jgi:4-oxalocrotonate tautomerase
MSVATAGVVSCDPKFLAPPITTRRRAEMPLIKITTSGARMDRSRIRGIAAQIGSAMAEILRKRPEVTSIVVDDNQKLWVVGGEEQKEAASLEVYVTENTNTPLEISDFIKRANEILRAALPELHVATYVIVKETPAEHWGYDGRTQRARSRAREEIVLLPDG